MFNRYREVLSLPGALAFSMAGVLARVPMAFVGISTILMVRFIYGSYTLAGLVSAANVIAYALCAPLLSRLVDRFGQAQVMIPSITISSLAMAGMIFSAMNVAPAPVLVAFSIINGATAGSIGALVRARWAHTVTDARQLQSAYAMEAAFDELVFVLGPVIATLLATSVHPTAGLWVALFFMVFGSLAFLLQTKTQPPANAGKKDQKRSSVMRDPAMIVLALTYIGTGALFGANDLSVVASAEAVGLSSIAGVILAAMSLGSLVSALVYGSRVWKKPLWILFTLGVGLLALGVSPFVLAPNLWVLAIMMFIAGIAIAPTMTNVNTIVQQIVPPARLTEGLTWMSTAMTFGTSLGSAVGGPVIDNYSYHGGFLVVLGFGWAMFLTAALGYKTLKKRIQTHHVPLPEEISDPV
ncbi:MFS transporter [Actinomycetaceae bacterium MB13-C1-2]|nr:MFS transporter [Actinomycetaceae bacterium MB13-C1-2]